MYIKKCLSTYLVAEILPVFAIWMLLLPSLSMGVVLNQGTASGAGFMSGAELQHTGNSANHINTFGQKNGEGQDQQHSSYIPGEVLVKFKDGVDDNKKKNIHEKMDVEVLSEIRQIGVHKIKSKHGLSTEELIHQYQNDPNVLFAEQNGIFYVQYNQALPNDPYFTDLWGMNNSGDTDIDAPEAWDIQTGSGVIVAVIDTGVDYTHPDLASNMVAGWDFTSCAQFGADGSCVISKARDSDPMDDYGHGTHVAGTIAAVGNNSIGVVGVSMNAKIMPIKVMNSYGQGSWEDIADGIIYASEHGAKISNNSYGSCCTASLTLNSAIATAKQNGMVLFIASSGNDALNNDKSLVYPCSSTEQNVICVAATDQNDKLASFSNYGATTVDLAAPGVSIYSTVPSGICALCDLSGYTYLQGTSMAAPHVTGAAALAMAQFPTYTADQIKNLLITSADTLTSLAGKVASSGRLNVNNALRPGIALSVSPINIQAGQSAISTVTVQALNNFSGTVTLNFASPDSNFTGSLSSRSVRLVNDSQTTTLTLLSTAGMTAGVYPLMVTGTFTNSAHQTETRTGIVVVTVQTDLAVTALTGPSSGQIGGWFTVSDAVQNQGAALAKGFYLGYYLSADSVITDTDVRIGSRWIPSLSAGSTSTASSDVWIPSELVSGTYYIGAIADDMQLVPDSKTTNNNKTANTMIVNAAVPASAVWVSRYNGPYNHRDSGYKINLDSRGNSIVSGNEDVLPPPTSNITTIKYSPEGIPIWTATADTGEFEWVMDQVVDLSDNTYIAIMSCLTTECNGYTIAVIKYDINGNATWSSPVKYDLASATSNALTVDNVGNFYLTGGVGQNGSCGLTGCVMATVKFDANGHKLWEDRGTTPASSSGSAIIVDSTGNVYVAGIENGGFTTRKYGPDGGTPLWKMHYAVNPGDGPGAIGLDSTGNVYVGGVERQAENNYDVVTLKYDNNGNQLWVRQYDNGGTEFFRSMSVDAYGNVYLAAVSANGKGYASSDYATIKYDADGNLQWVARFSDGSYEEPTDLAIDISGNVYVTGYACVSSISGCWGMQDYATIKYGPDGHPRWYARYNNTSSDLAHSLAVDRAGNVFVTGESGNPGTGFDFATLKYSSTTDNIAPSVPVGLTANVAGERQINLTWNASTDNAGVTYYILYRNGAEIATVPGTSYNDTGLTFGLTYSYAVAACDEGGNCSAQSTAVSATPSDATPPVVTLSLAGGVYTWVPIVKLSTNEPATIYYTLDGSTPSTVSPVYMAAITINSSVTLKYFAVDTAGNASTAQTQSYTIKIHQPTPGIATAWGNNDYGQTTIPVGLDQVTAIAGGMYHTIAVKNDGTVAAWGDNSYGQATVPAGLSGVVGIAAGSENSLALKSDGTVIGWGKNDFGQTEVSGLSGVVALAAGTYHTVALKNNGTIVAWGNNSYGQTDIPTGLSGITAIATGMYHTVALKSDGTVVAWGDNSYGQTNIPAGLNGVTAITVGTFHTVALKSDGTVVAWGDNSAGQAIVPTRLSGVTSIAAGAFHTLALKNDGMVVAWGDNSFSESAVPSSLSGVKIIAAGTYHSLAVFSDLVAPSVPAKLTAIALSTTQINLTWHSSTDNVSVTGYKVYRNGIQISAPSGTSYSDTGLKAATSYTYTVAACDAAGNCSAQSSAIKASTTRK